jgi:hypothetical protein
VRRYISVVLNPKQVRLLVEQLRKGRVEDTDAVPAALLEATLWTIGAREAVGSTPLNTS